MIRNYLKTSLRNLLKNKVISLINVLGLAVGMTTCLLILQHVNFELSFDQFHEKRDNIYRVINYRYQNGVQIQHGPITYPTIGPAMNRDYPEVEAYTRLMPMGRVNITKGEEVFAASRALVADEHFLSVFSFPLLAGNKKNVLKEPNAVVISASLARQHFDMANRDPQHLIGTMIQLNLNPEPFMITGVFEDVPANSHLDFDILFSYAWLIEETDGRADDSWQFSDFRHYLVLKPGTDVKALEQKFVQFSERYFKGNQVSGSEEEFVLQPLNRTHLFSNYEYDLAITSNGDTIWTLFYAGLFILIIAWINYVNLTTSKNLERAREVGLRKTLGARRQQLVFQFLIESLLINITAFLLAFTLTQAIQPFFNQLVNQDLSLLMLLSEDFIFSLFGVVFMSTVIAGIVLSGFYPAFILSAHQPAIVLKGKFQKSSLGQTIRRTLVVFQFVASVLLVSGTIVVFKQLKFIQDRDLGFGIKDTMVIRGPELTSFDSAFIDNTNAFKEELKKHAGIKAAATSGNIPSQRLGRIFRIRRPGVFGDRNFAAGWYGIDSDFLQTYQLDLLAGRNFVEGDFNTDRLILNRLLINEALADLLGFEDPEEAVNQKVSLFERDWTIVGVINNFHQESLHNPLEAILFFPNYGSDNYISLKIRNDATGTVVDYVKLVFEKFFPGNNFEFFFLDERYNRQYVGENRFSRTLSLFTFLAIMVACLGLFGLSSFTILQRTKEIGVRKVLGASVQNIVAILSFDFMRLIFIAGLIAIPLAYIGTNQWLNNYTYKISLTWWVYVLPNLMTLMIAFFTIGLQTFRAATNNPVKSLRQE